MSRYFGSEVAIEQLTWLIKGCGTCILPVGFVDSHSTIDMQAVSFPEFNKIYNIIDPNKKSENYYERYLSCIENIKNTFQYPQYYNGLIGLLLLFSHDDSYNFSNSIGVKKAFEDTKRVVMAGYEDFKDFRSSTIDDLISTVREMTDIFAALHGTHLSLYQTVTYENEISEIECYVGTEKGRVQIKPLNFSTRMTSKKLKTDPFLKATHHLALSNNEYHSEEQIMRTFKKFEQIFASVKSGYVLTTVIGNNEYSFDVTCFCFDIFIFGEFEYFSSTN